MSDSNVDVVRRLFEHYAERRRGGRRSRCGTRDIVIVIPPELSAEPDTYRGHEGVRRYFAGFEGMLEDVRYEVFELIPEGDDSCSRTSASRGRGVSSGLEVDIGGRSSCTRSARGKIARIRPTQTSSRRGKRSA